MILLIIIIIIIIAVVVLFYSIAITYNSITNSTPFRLLAPPLEQYNIITKEKSIIIITA